MGAARRAAEELTASTPFLPIQIHRLQSPFLMRNPVACVSCRSAKQKCIHNDAPPCDRCRQSGRAALCEFPPPGTSAIHRRPKRPRPSEETPGATPPGASAAATPLYRRNDAHLPSPTNAAPPLSPSAASSLLDGLDPFDLLTDEVKNSYLRCSYKWSFHHTPTLLLRIRDRTLEIYLAWAILALAVRYAEHVELTILCTDVYAVDSSKTLRLASVRRQRPAMPTPHEHASSSRATSRRRASAASKHCSCSRGTTGALAMDDGRGFTWEWPYDSSRSWT